MFATTPAFCYAELMVKKSAHSIFASFGFAFRGIWKVFLKERNIKIHAAIALLVILAGFYLNISPTEWLIIIITISMVIAAEIFNSSLEAFCDLMKARLNLDYYETYWVRNFSAAAVLVLAIGAAIIGLIIFLPKIF